MVNFADRMDGMKVSDIRELLKLTTRPEIISFAGGLPAPELFPVEDIKAATDAVMDEQGRPTEQKVYNADGELLYTLTNEYYGDDW